MRLERASASAIPFIDQIGHCPRRVYIAIREERASHVNQTDMTPRIALATLN